MAEPDPDDALEAQQQLLEDSLLPAFRAYDEAGSRKVKNPVVFLLDCEDEIGGQIARAWLGDEAVDEAIAEQHADEVELDDPGADQTTVFSLAFPFRQCREEVPAVFPYLAAVFEQNPPQDGFFVISVTAGGASIFTSPHSARPD